MKEDKKKIIKMSDELLKYFISKKAKKINIEIEEFEDKYLILANSIVDISMDELNYLNTKIKKNKDKEYEIFWELMGEVYEEGELELLFTLSDEVHMNYDDKKLNFKLEIYKMYCKI